MILRRSTFYTLLYTGCTLYIAITHSCLQAWGSKLSTPRADHQHHTLRTELLLNGMMEFISPSASGLIERVESSSKLRKSIFLSAFTTEYGDCGSQLRCKAPCLVHNAQWVSAWSHTSSVNAQSQRNGWLCAVAWASVKVWLLVQQSDQKTMLCSLASDGFVVRKRKIQGPILLPPMRPSNSTSNCRCNRSLGGFLQASLQGRWGCSVSFCACSSSVRVRMLIGGVSAVGQMSL